MDIMRAKKRGKPFNKDKFYGKNHLTIRRTYGTVSQEVMNVLEIPDGGKVAFYWDKKKLYISPHQFGESLFGYRNISKFNGRFNLNTKILVAEFGIEVGDYIMESKPTMKGFKRWFLIQRIKSDKEKKLERKRYSI